MLLDTSGLFCLFDGSDARHSEVVRLFDAASVRILHNYVPAELVALCAARGLNRAHALSFVADLQDSTLIEHEWVSESLHRAALALLNDRADKSYSLCDAASYLLMRARHSGGTHH